jgi:hypothetical protein
VLAKIQAKGSNNDYVYTDQWDNPLLGHYYRLRMQDHNGDYDYSNVVFVPAKESTEGISLRSNISHSGKIDIHFKTNGAEANIQIYSSSGRRISLPISISDGTASLDVTSLPTGCYYLAAQINGQSLNAPILVNR